MKPAEDYHPDYWLDTLGIIATVLVILGSAALALWVVR